MIAAMIPMLPNSKSNTSALIMIEIKIDLPKLFSSSCCEKYTTTKKPIKLAMRLCIVVWSTYTV